MERVHGGSEALEGKSEAAKGRKRMKKIEITSWQKTKEDKGKSGRVVW